MRTWKNCTRCKGTGVDKEFTRTGEKDAQGEAKWDYVPCDCKQCLALGTLPAPDLRQIVADIRATQGRSKGRVLKSFPSKRLDRYSKDWAVSTYAHRAYYVWRWFQFHSGRDVTMPMVAEWGYDDPYKSELNAIAEMLVFVERGHASAGLARWGQALCGTPAPVGLPWSAYEGGPVKTA